MRIPKWYSKSKSDKNCGFFVKRKVLFHQTLKNYISLTIKILQFLSDFDLLYQFGFSISKFHNKILIVGRSDDLKFLTSNTVRPKLWRSFALSRLTSVTSNLARNLVVPPYSSGIAAKPGFQHLQNRAHSSQGCT